VTFLRPLARRRPYYVLGAVIIAGLLCWEGLARSGAIDTQEWSYPTDICRTLWLDLFHGGPRYGDQNTARTLAAHIVITFIRFACGFALAAVLGVLVGSLLGISRTWYGVGFPFANLLRALPSAAVWPVCGVILGYGIGSQLVVIVFGAIWPILINTTNGIRLLPREASDSLRFMHLSAWQQRYVVLRWAFPSIVTGLEISCAVAFLLTITVEIFHPAKGGIGWYLNYHQEYREQSHVFAGLLVTALLGWLLNTSVFVMKTRLTTAERVRFAGGDVGDRSLWTRLASKGLPDSASGAILKTDLVTETVLKLSPAGTELRVLYQGRPYMWPPAALPFFGQETAPPNLIQRDIVLFAWLPQGANMRPVLFARSWINASTLTRRSQEQLEERRLTIGQIIRANENQPTYATMSYYRGGSTKLSAPFGRGGTIDLFRRLRSISIRGTAAILIEEFLEAPPS